MVRTISHYRLEEELGRGGTGSVYKASDTTLNRTVVLKLLAPDLVVDKESRSRFLREAQLASALDHPNICTVYEIGEQDDQCFIAMQFVPGETLTRVIGGRALRLDSLLSISLQVADALAAAHALKIVHRDIKPGNIIITPRGQAKVLDFGLAKLVTDARPAGGAETEDGELTRIGAYLGTPSYMSPEQARAERIDHRSDIFSFGVVLYEMATGRNPFKQKSPVETMNAVINQPHVPILERNRGIPPSLAGIIERALAKNPNDRFQSTDQLLNELRAAARAHWPAGASPPIDLSVPHFRPRRQSSLGGLSRWVGRLIGRETSPSAPPSQVSSAETRQQQPGSESLREPMTHTRTGPSVAVLPFVNMSADQENEYFCEGMAEELIDALTKIPGLRVASRSASFQFKGEAHDIRQIGVQLNVSHALEGSVRKAGNRIRITAQLASVDDGYHLWSEKYDRELQDVFAIQDEITQKIVEQLKVKLVGEQEVPRVKPSTQSIDAYTLYLKGRYYWNKRTEEAVKRGIESFQRAIETDPSYAAAYAGLADCYSILALTGADPPKECFERAKSAATRALEIDDSMAEAHASLAMVGMFYEWNWTLAENEFRRAIELDPKYPTAHQWYAEYLAAMDRTDEALAEIARALELDPLALMVITTVGIILYYARQYDLAVEPLQKALDLDPTFPPARRVLAWVYEQKAMREETLGEFQRAVNFSSGSVSMLADLGRFLGHTGQRKKAQQILDDLQEQSTRRYVSPYEMALVYMGLDKKDEVFSCLRRACEERYWLMVNLKVHPVWDGLRADPRFGELLRTIGLER